MNVMLRKREGAWVVQCFTPAPEPGKTLMLETPVPAPYADDAVLEWLAQTLQASQVQLLAATAAENG